MPGSTFYSSRALELAESASLKSRHSRASIECPCVDAPLEARRILRGIVGIVEVLPCVRPTDAAVCTPLACMEFEGQVQVAMARSRRFGHRWFS